MPIKKFVLITGVQAQEETVGCTHCGEYDPNSVTDMEFVAAHILDTVLVAMRQSGDATLQVTLISSKGDEAVPSAPDGETVH